MKTFAAFTLFVIAQAVLAAPELRRTVAAEFTTLKNLEDFEWRFKPSISRKDIYELAASRIAWTFSIAALTLRWFPSKNRTRFTICGSKFSATNEASTEPFSADGRGCQNVR
jgi:hypothetical protein